MQNVIRNLLRCFKRKILLKITFLERNAAALCIACSAVGRSADQRWSNKLSKLSNSKKIKHGSSRSIAPTKNCHHGSQQKHSDGKRSLESNLRVFYRFRYLIIVLARHQSDLQRLQVFRLGLSLWLLRLFRSFERGIVLCSVIENFQFKKLHRKQRSPKINAQEKFARNLI